MWIILGLGNPGGEYAATRHNVGFRVVERLGRRWGARLRRPLAGGLRARLAETAHEGIDVVLAQPTTYMNRVGLAAGRLLNRFRTGPDRMLAVYDDADLALGRIRIRQGGGAGGHNGVRSLIDSLRTAEFPRLKLGIRGASRSGDLHDYVLGPFDPEEHETVERMVGDAVLAVERILRDGLATAMNEFNSDRS